MADFDPKALETLRALYKEHLSDASPPEYTFNTPSPAPAGPPAKVYASGGAVDTLGGYDDYGAGRFTRTPAERREVRERAISRHRDPDDFITQEFDRLRDRHGFNPLSYGMEAFSRLDRAAGAAREGEYGWTLRDVWDNALSPDPRFRDENGIPGAVADALSIGATLIPGAGPAARGLGYVAPLVYGAGAGLARGLGFAGGGKVVKFLADAATPLSRKMEAPRQYLDLNPPDNDNLSRQSYQAILDWAASRKDEPAFRGVVDDILFRNELDEQWRRPLAAPRVIDEYAGGGKVAKAIKLIGDKFGSFQAERMQRAADETNLERLSTQGLQDTFNPRNSGLYVSMPPGDFQDYAMPLPAYSRDAVPYPRWPNIPPRKRSGFSRDDETLDNYLDLLAPHLERRGMDDAPSLWMYRNLDDLTAIEGHEGRHRMMALDRMGDPRSLVRLQPANSGELGPALGKVDAEDVVDRLMRKYAPRGAGQLVVPESLSPELQRLPRPIYNEPYAGGGKVLSLIERLVGGKPKEVKLPGGATMPAYPIKEFEDVADTFATRYGNAPIENYPKLDEDRARKIAEAYELMKHDPSDPRVKRAYDALIDETMDQYRALEGTGARFEFLKPGEADPYALSPSLGYKDLVDNGRLKVFPTEQGYGTQTDINDNPLLRRVGRVGDLDNATANDAFRVVHDALGHFGPGNPFFRAPGEERAWLNHMRAYSPDALPAATSETRGQNSWVNFGPRAAENRGASGADTVYADQKAGLLPEWMWEPDATGYRDGGKVLKAAKRFLIDPLRESFPGVYKDPDVLVREAREHLVPDPGKEGAMYRLFGHTRDSLDELSQGSRDLDSIQPFLREHPYPLRGENDVVGQLMNRRNANRLVNSIGEALDDPQLRTTRSWYEMSPLWDRANEVGVGDKGMRDLNYRMAVMSAGSDPRTEINRGFHANWLANEGRLEDFVRHGGTPDHLRDGDFPDDLRSLMGHAYHGTAQVPNLLDYETSGRLWPTRHKVPTYAAATDPRNPYSERPVADSHFSRIVGFPDVSTASTEAVRQGTMPGTAYSQFVPWFNEKVADQLDMRPRDAQALLWNLGGPQTGVRYIGPSKLEMIADYMDEVARLRQIAPEEARDQLLRGEIGGAWDSGSVAPFASGGEVDFDNQYQSQFYASGGSVGDVVPWKDGADDALGYMNMHYFGV